MYLTKSPIAVKSYHPSCLVLDSFQIFPSQIPRTKLRDKPGPNRSSNKLGPQTLVAICDFGKDQIWRAAVFICADRPCISDSIFRNGGSQCYMAVVNIQSLLVAEDTNALKCLKGGSAFRNRMPKTTIAGSATASVTASPDLGSHILIHTHCSIFLLQL